MKISEMLEIYAKGCLSAADLEYYFVNTIFIYFNKQQLFMPQQVDNTIKLATQETQMTRTFSNPVCKQTYNSLPRIYGKKKKMIKINLHSFTKQSNSMNQPHYLSANEQAQQISTRNRRTYSMSNKLSTPKNHLNCQKKNCACHRILTQQKADKKKIQRKMQPRKIRLPEIRKFQLEDLQSQHKVTRTNLKLASKHVSGLQQIIMEQQSGNMDDKNSYQKFHSDNSTRNAGHTKYKHKFKPIFNSKKGIQQLSDQQKNTQEMKKKKQIQQSDNQKLQGSRRYATQMNDSSENGLSKDSLSISSFIFKNSKRPNTNYHSLNKSQKTQQEKATRSRVKSILSNGLFRIPQQPQYKDYLKGYRPLQPKFTIKQLISSPNFKIIKQDKGVYFGNINQQQQKHGRGLMVSERQIFQGQYQRNLKIIGFQRNIDGIYEGGYKNGLRSGQGKFTWNNGQVFQGNWQAGMKNGFGIWKSPKGDFYEGQWKNNRQNGRGIFKHKMSTYKGQFINFLKHGQGEQIFANGDKYKGFYQSGKPHGKGRYEWHQGGYYEGNFKKGFRQGQGIWIDENGTIYQGKFKKDCKHGWGIQKYKSGERFQGQFSQGLRQQGYIRNKDGTKISVKGQ